MSITVKNRSNADVVYTQLSTEGTRSTLIGPAHSDVVKDAFIFNSTPPKRAADSFGNRRSSLNLVRSVTVDSPAGASVSKDAKIELVFSLPVGITANDVDDLISRIVTMSGTVMKDVALIGKTQQ